MLGKYKGKEFGIYKSICKKHGVPAKSMDEMVATNAVQQNEETPVGSGFTNAAREPVPVGKGGCWWPSLATIPLLISLLCQFHWARGDVGSHSAY